MKLYRDFNSQEEIDEQYNIGASMPGWETYIDRYLADSETTRQELDCKLDIQYGPTLDEHLDIFPSTRPNSPVLVFIHGGYWRALSSKEFSFVARVLVEQGITVVASNYSLCPKVSIAEITRQNRAVIAWLAKHVQQYNGDPDLIFVSGHSAGGHLTAMVCSTDWQGEYGLGQDTVKGGIAISGIYDLRPFRYSYLQPVLSLSHELIREQSPCFTIPENGPDMLMSVGEKEASEFHRQAQDYQQAWQAKGMKGEYQSEAGEDHFSILYELVDPSSALFNKVMEMIKAQS
jgi:arylformamidase